MQLDVGELMGSESYINDSDADKNAMLEEFVPD